MNRRILLFVFVSLLAAIATSASASPGNALVIDGKKGWLSISAGLADNKAVSCLEGKGYTVDVNSGGVDLNDPNHGAPGAIQPQHEVVVMIGHGAYDDEDEPMEGIMMKDGSFFCSTTVQGVNFPQVKQLFLMGCGQLMQDSWQELFPNARIYGYLDTVSWLVISNNCGKLPADNPSPDEAKAWASKSTGSTFVLAEVHPSLQAVPHTIIVEGKKVGNPGSPLNPLHQPPNPAYVQEFGSGIFNLWIDSELLVGIQTADGVVVDYSEIEGYPSPDFDIRLTEEDYLESLRLPTTLNAAYSTGRIWIGNNSTGLSQHTLFCAFAGFLYGITPSDTSDIPTVSQWGLIIMAGLLLTVGAVVIWRRFKTVPA